MAPLQAATRKRVLSRFESGWNRGSLAKYLFEKPDACPRALLGQAFFASLAERSHHMVKIDLKGQVKEFESGITAAEVAKSIGMGLYKSEHAI